MADRAAREHREQLSEILDRQAGDSGSVADEHHHRPT
jgi:hypothetical protein